MKIYTKTGDKGETSLFDGTRVPKHDPRVEAYGDVDELNALLGTVRASLTDQEVSEILASFQRDLFAIGAQLADPKFGERKRKEKVELSEARVKELEEIIDRCESELPPLKHFILPGGGQAGALLHLGRTICRRAERRTVALKQQGTPVPPIVVMYLNRLSDLLFVLARVVNHRQGVPEVAW
ncbi:MAG: cob(I)yrinic acid a,c-diamide adenosyltransferase [Candidatus Methylomirabilales bacterium]